MSQELGSVTLPDFPEGLFDTYSYGVVFYVLENGVKSYVLAVAKNPIYVGQSEENGEYAIAYDTLDYALYMDSGQDSWTLLFTGSDQGMPLSFLGASGDAIIWANHDLKAADVIVDLDNMTTTTTPREEVYFLDSTVAVPELCYAPGTFFRGIAEEVRRLTGNLGKRYTIDTMRPALKNVDPADDTYKWLDSVTIDSSTKAMSSEAEELTMPANCRMVNDIASADLPNALTIGAKMFSYCANLASVNAPLVTKIASTAFEGCTKLQTADFPNCEYIGGAFKNCTALETVNFPVANDIQFASFEGCTSLKEVSLPAADNFENRIFLGCTSLEKVDLGNPCYISAQVFYNCTSLTTVILRNTDAVCPNNNTDNFYNTPIASGTGYIYVPSALVDSYKAATNWSTYANQIRAIEDYPDICGTT